MPKPAPFRIEVEGYKEFQAAARKARGELPKVLGQLHKDIGTFIISRLHPPAVGSGAGARVRPSASKRDVLIRVGGGHRNNDPRKLQWGKTQEFDDDGRAPERPDILGTARKHQQRIEEMLLRGIEKNFKPPFQ